MKAIRRQKRIKLFSMLCSVAAVFVVAFLIFTQFFGASAESIENDTRVEENSELKYFLSVKYDGVDRYGVESSENATATLYAGNIQVKDKIPDGLTFEGFVTSPTGKFGAVLQSDENTTCPGEVVDDTQEEAVDEGTWNSDHSEYYYHGLHYSEATRTVEFTVTELQAGCKLNVGIITRTPFLGDAARKDFYNTATGFEDLLNWNSNTVHVWMGRESARLYNVSYSYSGNVPANAPALPASTAFAAGTTVSVADEPRLQGYVFSGWQNEAIELESGNFTMPEGDVEFIGEFVPDENYREFTVSYRIDGDAPAGFSVPAPHSYGVGETVEVDDSYAADDVIDGYKFSGWSVHFLRGLGETFTMPDCDVEIVGSFERLRYTVSYEIDGSISPENINELLPESKQYFENDAVAVADDIEADGYSFSGWNRSDFTMPAENVVVLGRFAELGEAFHPEIKMEIVDKKSVYVQDETVKFAITVTNTADYPIREVMIKEDLDGVAFVAGDGYVVKTDNYAMIPELGAGESVVLYAEFKVTENKDAHFVNIAKIVSAIADNDHYLANDVFEARAEFDTQEIPGPPIEETDEDNPNTGMKPEALVILGVCLGVAALFFMGQFARRRGLAKLVCKILGGISIAAVATCGLVSVAKTVFADDAIPLHSADASSSKFNYDEGESGAWKVTTSGIYVQTRDQIQLNYKIEASEKRDERPLDVVIVLGNDVSVMNLNTRDYAQMIANYVLESTKNRVGVVSYAGLNAPLGRDASAISAAINATAQHGHSLLSEVDELLSDYEESDDRRLVVITLGGEMYDYYKNTGIANKEVLRERFPGITLNYAQFEHWTLGSISDFFDNTFIFADSWWNGLGHPSDVYTFAGAEATETLEEITNPTLTIDSISVESYINDEYFDFPDDYRVGPNGAESNTQIAICLVDNETHFGDADLVKGAWKLSYEGNTPKIVFTINDLKTYKGAHKVDCTVFLKAKEGTYPNETGHYPVTRSQTVRAEQRDDANINKTISEVVDFAKQPTVIDRYTVSYSANQPSDCEVTGVPETQTHLIFDTVEYAQNIRCEGYNLRALSVLDEDMARYRGGSFRMPQQDVNIRASWSKVSIDKSMDGEIFEVKPAYLIPGSEFRSKLPLTYSNVISSFTRADSLPDSLDITDPKYLISTEDSALPVYMWSETDERNSNFRRVKYYTAANEIYANPNSSGMFKNVRTPWSGDPGSFEFLSELNTSLVTDMSEMFGGYYTFDFNYVEGGTEVFRYWDVSNVTNMASMFYYDNLGDTSGLHDWDTSSLVYFSSAFNGASMKDTSGLEDWDMSHVTGMQYTFAYIDFTNKVNPLTGLKKWDVSSLENMLCAFRGSRFESLEGLEDWNTSSLVSMEEPFEGNNLLNDISALREWDVSNVNHMGYLFANDTALTDVSPLEKWDTHNVVYLYQLFYNAGITSTKGLEHKLIQEEGKEPYYAWDLSSARDLGNAFSYAKMTSVEYLADWDISHVADISGIFSYSELADASGLLDWDTSNISYMSNAFKSTKLKNLHGLENWVISNANTSYMFAENTQLENVDALIDWDTSSQTSMTSLFNGCTNLNNISGLSNWNTSNLTGFNYVFEDTGITNVDALATKLVTPADGEPYYAWDMSNVTSIWGLFRSSENLSDISALATWNIKLRDSGLDDTFDGTGITSLEALRNWDVSGITSLSSTFRRTSQLRSLSGLDGWYDKLDSLTRMSWTFMDSGVEDATAINNWQAPNLRYKTNAFGNTPANTNGLLPSWY